MNTIITIGRQFGSGGHGIGRRLAEKLGIPCYDKELILLAAQKSGMSADVFAHVDETATNSFLYAVSSGMLPGATAFSAVNNMPLNDQLFIAQTEIIRAKAAEGPCVFVGRCADFVLKQTDTPLLNVFVRADLPFRVARIMEAEGCTERAAEDLIAREDKKRSKYYTFYTRNRWGNVDNYDLVINNAKLGAEQAVALIAAYAQAMSTDTAAR
ncbi:MAG: cytidylate kinase-like family protein [Clostridia bacterium]|nr:cytidylate kinase-like family protein [Clostridia bacterium]